MSIADSKSEAQVMRMLSDAQALYAAGRYAQVMERLHALNSKVLPPPLARRLLALRVSALYGQRLFREAERGAQDWVAVAPEDPTAWLTLGLLHCRLGRPAQALPILRRAESLGATGYTLHDTLASTLAQVGDRAGALRHGEQALTLKDGEASAKPPTGRLRRTQAPPFRADQPGRNIIAFGLWGDNPKYTEGALVNARQAKAVYPGWTCRFYADDTVPAEVIRELEKLGSQIVPMPRPRFPEEGMFWRFTVSDDPSVDRFLVRDADCEPSERERRAVEAWIASGKLFHAMRDHPAHTELMLGGLWGGVAGALPPIKELMADFSMANHSVLDQVFLRQRVWPLAKASILVHDGHYRVLGAQPFPIGVENPPGRHVGVGIGRKHQVAASPLVSVIMPAHNAEPFIGEAIQSILGQTFRDFELIVVDDGSTDGTAGEIAKFTDPRIVVLRNGRNLGPSAARNRALDVARGKFVAIMDADDVSLPNRLERNLAWMEKRPDCVAVGGGMLIWHSGQVPQVAVAKIEPAQARRMVLRAPPVNHATAIIRRKAFDAGVRYRPEFDGAEDYRLWLDLLAHGELATEPEVVYKYRMHPGQQAQAGREKVEEAAERVRRAAGESMGEACR